MPISRVKADIFRGKPPSTPPEIVNGIEEVFTVLLFGIRKFHKEWEFNFKAAVPRVEHVHGMPEDPAISATRKKADMMDIIDYIWKSSDIDDAVYGNMNQGIAQKIPSLSHYLPATNGQILLGITTWQYTHPFPYEYGLLEDVYHGLFRRVGRDESLMQGFFVLRLSGADGTALLAYNSTTVSTCSGEISKARYRFNKAQDGLETDFITLVRANIKWAE